MSKKINMRKLNRTWRKVTGRSSMAGVKLTEKMAAVIEASGQRVPHSKTARAELVMSIMYGGSLPGATKKIHGAADPTKPKRAPAHKGKSFYSSWDWKRARYEALRINGNRCQCCGWRPGDTEHGHLVVDHIQPRSKRPDLELDVGNLQVLCNDCNMGKSNQFADDFRDLEAAYRDMTR